VAAGGVKPRNTPSEIVQKFRTPVRLNTCGAVPATKAELVVPPPPVKPSATKV